MIHLVGKQREHGGKCRAHGTIARHRGRCDRSVRDDEVRETGAKDEIRSRAERHRRDDGRDPVDVLICGESQAEEADRDEHAAHLAHHETELGWRIAIFLDKAPVASMKDSLSFELNMEAKRGWGYSFQYGIVANPMRKPIPMPRKLKPVICIEKPCTFMKMIGNASKARY